MRINYKHITILLATLCILLCALGVATARAGTWIQVSCPAASKSAVASPGWSSYSGLAPGKYDGASTVCGESHFMHAWLSAMEPAHVNDSQELVYEPPVGSTLDGGWLEMTTLAPGHGSGTHAEVGVYAPSLSGTPFWSCAYEACPQGTKNSYAGRVNIPAGTGGDLYVTVICWGTGSSTCSETEDPLVWADTEVKEAHLLLSNDATPNATGFGGSLLESNVRGTQELDVTANDPNGPGVYSVAVEIEGTTVYSGIPNTNGGACVPYGTTNAGVLMFTSRQPCLQTEAVRLPVETALVPDGQHSVRVIVTDAAKNTTTVFAGNITTHNAPVTSTSPMIVAPTGVSTGVALSSTPGQWSGPADAGTITDAYQWERCSTAGKECQAIPGATAATYTPVQADAGHTLKLAVTALNNDGQAATESAATGIVASASDSGAGDPPSDPPAAGATTAEITPMIDLGAPNGMPATRSAHIELAGRDQITRRESKSAFPISGTLTTATGQAIAGATIEVISSVSSSNGTTVLGRATTLENGRFAFNVPPGPSRAITVAYRAFANDATYAAEAKVTENVTAAVRLHITPRHTSPTGVVTITGTVLGAVPRGGVTVALEVWYLGRWVAFRDPVTDNRGRFSVRYQFERSRGTFPFRVRTLSNQAGFAYRVGCSNRVDVETG